MSDSTMDIEMVDLPAALSDWSTQTSTLCHTDRLAMQPHVHLLSCGHFISTRKITPCASNCRVDLTPGAGISKGRAAAFICPDRTCMVKMERKEITAVRKTKRDPRVLRKIHVWGVDSQLDELHRAELDKVKERKAAKVNGGSNVVPSVFTEQELALFARKPSDGVHIIAAVLPEAAQPTKEQVKPSWSSASDVLMAMVAGQTSIAGAVEATQSSAGERQTPFVQTMQQEGLTAEEHDHQESDEADTWDGLSDEELHCSCQSAQVEFMLECQECKKLFHKGCQGQGAYQASAYDTDKIPEERVRRHHEADLALHRQSERDYYCSGCEVKRKERAAAKAGAKTGARAQKSTARNRTMAQFQGPSKFTARNGAVFAAHHNILADFDKLAIQPRRRNRK